MGPSFAFRRSLAAYVATGLPRGRTLPAAAWRSRHVALLWVLAAHVALLPVFGLAEGWSPATSLGVVAPSAVLGLLAASDRPGRIARSACCALGLLSCSAALVILWHGTIEAHFHYFVITAALALYEEWLVYGLAVGYVVAQHGLMSQIKGEAVFAHPMTMAGTHGMWFWALVHGGFIAALSVANIVSWGASEAARRQAAEAYAAVRHQADHDPLTELVNRARFAADLKTTLAARPTGRLVGVLFIDVDDFKLVNDCYGHETGDRLLVAVAQRLRDALRPDDVLGRFGGDEFVICVTASSKDEIERIADRVGLALAAPLVLDTLHRTTTASIGIAIADGDCTSPERLIRDADSAMYMAKSRGKACRQTYDSAIEEQLPQAVAAPAPQQPHPRPVVVSEPSFSDLAGELRRILDEDLIVPAFQPVVELGSRTTVGYEALARGPEDSPLAQPYALFAAAREAGLLGELDWACRAAAVRMARRGGLPAGHKLFVNVEPAALGIDCPPRLRAAWEADAAELDLVFEITERALTARPADLLRAIAGAREQGWAIALDDVGADVRSLALMGLVAPEIIKLDLRLVQRHADGDIAAIVHAVSAEHERTGAIILAEGVETEEHLRTAKALGATVAQGWLFGRPGPLGNPVEPARAPLAVRAMCQSTSQTSPYAVVAERLPTRLADKRLLLSISHSLERQATGLGSAAVIVSAFQDAARFTLPTTRRYARLAADAALVAALGVGMDRAPAPGVRGAALDDDDPLSGEWSVVVIGPHHAVALVASDLGDDGPDLDRRFAFALTYDRPLVLEAARSLIARISPVAGPPVRAWGDAATLVPAPGGRSA